MPAPVIVSACRTPIGTAFKGTLAQTSALDLAGTVLREVVERSGAPVAAFDDVVLGESMYGGGVIGRYAAVAAGMTEVPGMAVNRHCATSLSTLCVAAGSIAAGMDQLVVAGGVTSASTNPRTMWRVGQSDEWEEAFSPSHPDRADAPNVDMSITVGWNAARSHGITREEMDDWAHRSHQRALAAQDAGLFDSEIVAVPVVLPDGTAIRFDRDEHPRRGVPREKLAALKVLHPEIDGFSITAANSSGVNDGAAAVAVATEARAAELGLSVLGRVLSWASVGVDPHDTGLSPIKAIPLALKRAGLSIADVDLWEINEAFAVVPLTACRALGIDDAIVNVSGSGCSLGHPIAATGARMVVTLTHELRRRGGGIAVASMCAGGGMGTAVVLDIAGA